MKSLYQCILESQDTSDLLDMEWIDNDKPVITKSGIEVKIDDVDMTKIPNQVKGKVYYDDKGEVDGWIWDETGKCLQCKDKYGNGYRPGEDETLVKNLDNE